MIRKKKLKHKIEELKKEIIILSKGINSIQKTNTNLARCLNQIARLELDVSSPNPTTPFYQELLRYTDKILSPLSIVSVGLEEAFNQTKDWRRFF